MQEAAVAIASGRELVSALFVIPYPPGFPILVPGQVISSEILKFMAALDVKEIHGFRPELGFRVFTQETLDRVLHAKESFESIMQYQQINNLRAG